MSTTRIHFDLAEYSAGSPQNTLVLVGTALDGPSQIPFRLNENFDVYQTLGVSPLANAFVAARSAGASDVILYRLNGTHASATIHDWTLNQDVIRFTSVSANAVINDTQIHTDDQKMTVINGAGESRYYFFREYRTAEELVSIINRDAEFGLIEFSAEALIPDYDMGAVGFGISLFNNGNPEESFITDRVANLPTLKRRLEVALFGMELGEDLNYDPEGILGIMDYGVICLVDLFHDEDPTITETLANFCSNKSLQLNQGCMGVIGTSPFTDITEQGIQSKLQALLKVSSKAMNQGTAGATSDAGEVIAPVVIDDPLAYVQVVVGDSISHIIYTDKPQYASLAYSYAGAQAALPYYASTTNKPLGNIVEVSVEFVKEDIDKLLANGYISIVTSIRKGFVPYSATIFSRDHSFTSPNLIRISHQVARLLAEELDEIIGDYANPGLKKGMQKRLQAVLAPLVEAQIIKNYEIYHEFLNHDTELKVTVVFTAHGSVSSLGSVVRLPFGGGA